jgi:ABC-2 type transport system ATP-binding protein
MSVDEPAVEIAELVIRYGQTVAVDHATFSAHRGTVSVLLGHNGAGKTSAVEAAEGYRRPFSGMVRVLGIDPHTHQRALASRMGVMLQGGGIAPGLRAGEAVSLFCAYHEARAEHPGHLLRRVGLDHRADATWRELSGGEQQRLSLALALAGRPEVVFLDEPTSGVDVQGRQMVRQVVRDLAEDGCCVVMTTHELDEAERVADRVVIVHQGRVVADGTLAELCGDTDGVRFTAPAGLDLADLGATEHAPGTYLVAGAATPDRIAALAAALATRSIALNEIGEHRRSLEDVVLALTGSTTP